MISYVDADNSSNPEIQNKRKGMYVIVWIHLWYAHSDEALQLVDRVAAKAGKIWQTLHQTVPKCRSSQQFQVFGIVFAAPHIGKQSPCWHLFGCGSGENKIYGFGTCGKSIYKIGSRFTRHTQSKKKKICLQSKKGRVKKCDKMYLDEGITRKGCHDLHSC